jgi:hypothetical protein
MHSVRHGIGICSEQRWRQVHFIRRLIRLYGNKVAFEDASTLLTP